MSMSMQPPPTATTTTTMRKATACPVCTAPVYVVRHEETGSELVLDQFPLPYGARIRRLARPVRTNEGGVRWHGVEEAPRPQGTYGGPLRAWPGGATWLLDRMTGEAWQVPGDEAAVVLEWEAEIGPRACYHQRHSDTCHLWSSRDALARNGHTPRARPWTDDARDAGRDGADGGRAGA